MEPGHHHFPEGAHGDGLGLWWLWPIIPTLSLLLLLLLLLWVARDLGGVDLVAGARARFTGGPQARWHAAVARHNEIAAAFAAYECNPQAVLHRPALADVRQPATARFVEAFAEACALATDRYPGRPVADAFAIAVDRAGHAWSAAAEAAERLRAVQFAPGERDLLDQAAALLALVRESPHEGERRAAYARLAQRLAELQRRCGWVLPQQAAVVLHHEARRALAGVPGLVPVPGTGLAHPRPAELAAFPAGRETAEIGVALSPARPASDGSTGHTDAAEPGGDHRH